MSLLIDDHSLDVVDITDFLRGPKVEQLRLQGVEHVYHITALEGKIYFRSYRFVIYNFSFFFIFFNVTITSHSVCKHCSMPEPSFTDIFKKI